MKIVRTLTKAKGGITAEEKEKLDQVRDKFIENAFQTGSINKTKITAAIEKLYEVSGLKKPRVVVVPSPLVMALSYGLAAGWWYLKKQKIETYAATYVATDAATHAATCDAIYAATDDATRAATHVATIAATNDATDDATRAATHVATNDATDVETCDAIRDATDDATRAATHVATIAATNDATDDATYVATRDATYAATRAATHVATVAATDAATRDATRDATYAATDSATYVATDDATRDATDAATDVETRAATADATIAATDFATVAAIYAATDDATHDATHDATVDATVAATDDATIAAIYAATDDATHDATHDATRDATRDATVAATDDATIAATIAATRAATHDATYDATVDATVAATDDATIAATDDATIAATRAATIAATHVATRDATYAATYAATRDATDAATETTLTKINKNNDNWLTILSKHYGGENYKILLKCINRWKRVYQGGNMWSGWLSYAYAMREVIGLKGLDCWEKYQAYEDSGIYGGFRAMHEEFCIVSDFPEILKVDDQNRPHCEDGPSHRWKDGFEIYHINGVRVPKYVIMEPEKITIDIIQKEKNQEVRRIMIEKYGVSKYLTDTNSTVVDMDCRTNEGAAPRVLIKDCNGNKWLVCTDGSTERVYHLFVENNINTCREAHESVCGFNEDLMLIES